MTKNKSPNFRVQIQDRLEDSGWEVAEIVVPDEWWCTESWEVRSVRQRYGLRIIISFIVDLMYEGSDREKHIACVFASEGFPQSYNDRETLVAELCMYKGHFSEMLTEFVGALDQYRSTGRS